MSTRILHIPPEHALNQLAEPLKQRIVIAQSNGFCDEFANAFELCSRVFSDLKMAVIPNEATKSFSTLDFGDRSTKELVHFYSEALASQGVPKQALLLHAANLSYRTQLLRAFHNPDQVIEEIGEKVSEVINGFPKTIDSIRKGRNPGDVLDPYIMAAAQMLMCEGNFENTISATVAHKVLMIIEGLLGHLHEDVIGAMRENVRVPEPRGKDQETLDFISNPFPGADIMQPPTKQKAVVRFHQVKSKTGSAKGGDGKRLGMQLNELQKTYGGELFYDALIGTTLKGHRSMAGVLRESPSTVVLVGQAALRELTGSTIGPQLLLRLYQSVFSEVHRQTGYSLQKAVATIFVAFQERASQLGEDFLEAVLFDAITGTDVEQDSRLFNLRHQNRKKGRGLSHES